MKKIKLAILILIIMILSSCSPTKEVVRVYNWGDYIDKEVLKQFEEETGIKVKYDTFATNEDLYVRMLQSNNEFDLIFPSDYMIERMVSMDMLEKLDFTNIPNVKYVNEEFRNLAYDRDEEYSVPYMWGTVGIGYNKKLVKKAIDSWDILWDNDYRDSIIMLNSQRDSFAVSLLRLGYSMNTRSEEELIQAKEELVKQKDLVYAYQGDEVKDTMVSGDAALAVLWSGEAVAMKLENEDLDYIIPKEGTNLWFDSMVIPKNAENKENAERLINFLTRPDISAKNAEYIEYSTPIDQAKELLPDYLKNMETAYPDIKSLGKFEIFKDPKDILPIYDGLWTELMSE